MRRIVGNMEKDMSKEDRKQSLVIQAGILAAAGVIVRIIGLLYNTPLVLIIKDEGFGYYDSAYAAYSIVLMISSLSIPSAVSKVMAQKIALGEYRNAHRIFKCTLIYVFGVGIIASLFVYFGAGFLVKMESAVLPLKILAPTIFFSGFLGAFRGFFQARHSMVQTSISQIIEQIVNAGISVLMAYVLYNFALDAYPGKEASFGAAGSTIGTGAGVIVSLIFMMILYFSYRKKFMIKVAEDTTHKMDSYKDIFKLILMVVTPFILSTGIYNINAFLDKSIYQIIMMGSKNVKEAAVAFDLSAFAKANKIANIPIALAAAMGIALIPRLSANVATDNFEGARAQIAKAIKVTMYVSIPAAVGIGVLAKPIMRVIFPQKESLQMSSIMLIILALTVVFYGLSTLTQAVLQAIGRMNTPIVNALIALGIHAVLLVLALRFLPSQYAIYYYGISTIVYSLILSILNGRSVAKYMNYKQECDKTFIRPTVSSVVMGILVWVVYTVLNSVLNINFVALAVSVILGAMLYLMLTIKWKAISEDELLAIPKGHLIIKMMKKLRVL